MDNARNGYFIRIDGFNPVPPALQTVISGGRKKVFAGGTVSGNTAGFTDFTGVNPFPVVGKNHCETGRATL